MYFNELQQSNFQYFALLLSWSIDEILTALVSHYFTDGSRSDFEKRASFFHRPPRWIVRLLLQHTLFNTVGIGYCDYHPVTHVSACDTVLPIANWAKNDILLLWDRLLIKYHLLWLFFWHGPKVVTIPDTICSHSSTLLFPSRQWMWNILIM